MRYMSRLFVTSDMGLGALFFLQFQGYAPSGPASTTDLCPSVNLLIAVLLAAHLLRDTTWTTSLRGFTGRLVAPFWHGLRERFRILVASSAGRSPSLQQWLRRPSPDESNTRPGRSALVSQNRAPPHPPAISTCSDM